MFDMQFKPVLRFVVMSDIHYGDEEGREQERTERALDLAYKLSDSDTRYNKIDALYVVGDFATSGSDIQMNRFKKTLDEHLRSETKPVLMLASHEFHRKGETEGEAGALAAFDRIFKMPADDHQVINGFHFISLTTTHGCDFSPEKVAYAKDELLKARKADPKKPIFFFQHPHITDTVSGSIYWADDALYTTLMDYPQVIDFSGHSHVPINDPRSIHQKHFTCLGTGSMSYTELDEFDKVYGTLPPHKEDFAQMLIVEADENGAVRVYPYDVFTEQFFPMTWKIDTPWDPDSFLYTDARYKTAGNPWFEDESITFFDVKADGFSVTFPQAKTDDWYVNDYKLTVLEKDTGVIIRQACIWSEYYFSNMPETLTVSFDGLDSGDYTVKIVAGSFWNTYSKPIFADIKTK